MNMELNTLSNDPLNILSSTKKVLERARFVFIDEQKIKEASRIIAAKLERGLESAETSFGVTGDYQKDAQLVFVENTVNFCFWAEANKKRWQIQSPSGELIGGWYGLKTCFERALKEKVPILEAKYLAEIDEKETKQLFGGTNETEIPLINERQKNLQETGRILLERYQGQFINVLEEANYNAINLVKLVHYNFNSFYDVAELDGQKIIFLKRAQICPNDISYLKDRQITGLEQLTAFADYRLPQILREFGVLIYISDLAQKIDQMILIPQGSREEIEIRAATIWAIELMHQHLLQYSAGQIDNAIWLLSQEANFLKIARPHHRTYSIFY